MAWLTPHYWAAELSGDEARKLYAEDFVSDWNSGRLATKYYAGLVQAPARRTAHQWGFSEAGGSGAKGVSAFLDDQKEK